MSTISKRILKRVALTTAIAFTAIAGFSAALVLPFNEWLAPLIAWAKGNIAEWHASTTFNILGWVVDKFAFLAGVVICVVLIVAVFFLWVAVFDSAKPEEDQPRKRPGMED